MNKISLIARIAAFGASAAMTFAIVTALAEYGLPADDGTRVLVQASPASVK